MIFWKNEIEYNRNLGKIFLNYGFSGIEVLNRNYEKR